MAFVHTWLIPADVTGWLLGNGAGGNDDAATVERVCAMTEAYVERCRPEFRVPPPDPMPDPPPDPMPPDYVPDAETYQGAVMYAARELRRRNNPGGVDTFGDAGVLFNPRFDSDIERALRTGANNRPGSG